MSPRKLKNFHKSETARIRKYRKERKDKASVKQAPESSIPIPNSYKFQQVFAKALARFRLSLPNSPNKRKKVVHGLVCEVG